MILEWELSLSGGSYLFYIYKYWYRTHIYIYIDIYIYIYRVINIHRKSLAGTSSGVSDYILMRSFVSSTPLLEWTGVLGTLAPAETNVAQSEGECWKQKRIHHRMKRILQSIQPVRSWAPRSASGAFELLHLPLAPTRVSQSNDHVLSTPCCPKRA